MKTDYIKFTPIIAAFALMAGGFSASANTVTLETSSQDQTIEFQEKVNSLNEGDTLQILSGPHYISNYININSNNVDIIGTQGAVIRKISGTASGLTLYGSYDRIDQIEIDGGGEPDMPSPCLVVQGGWGDIITNSKFHNAGDDTGLLLNNTVGCLVQGCQCYYNYRCGISQSGCVNDSILDDQLCTNGAEGLTIDDGSDDCTVSNCWIHMNNTGPNGVGGIGIDGSGGGVIEDCTIDFNGYNGITFQNNLDKYDNGWAIINNQNISYNEHAGLGIHQDQLVLNLSHSGNTWAGNGYGWEYFYPCQISNVSSGLSLNVKGGSMDDNAEIIQYGFTDTANELWTFLPYSDGYYQIVNYNSGLDAVVFDASTSEGTNIVQYSFGSIYDNDQWMPITNGDRTWTFVNRNSGQVLEDPNFNKYPGTQMDQWDINYGSNQRWRCINDNKN